MWDRLYQVSYLKEIGGVPSRNFWDLRSELSRFDTERHTGKKQSATHVQTHTYTHKGKAPSGLQKCNAVCCSMLQFDTVFCGVLQCVAGKNQAATNTWITVMT